MKLTWHITSPSKFRFGRTPAGSTPPMRNWNDRFQFRIGGAFPLAQRPNRNFDGEVIAQMNFIP